MAAARCMICGAEFLRRRSHQKACGEECRKMLVHEKQRRYREAHRDELRERQRRYCEAHIVEVHEQQRRYREAHRDELRERRYREAHRDELRERQRWYVRRYREAHIEEIRERQRRYREVHREELREWNMIHLRRKRAAARLGLPPLLYAALLVLDLHSRSRTGEVS